MLADVVEVVIRKGAARDLEQVIRVLLAANAEFETMVPATFYRAYMANVVDLARRPDASELFVAEWPDEGIVGAITFFPNAADELWGWPPNWTGIRAVAVHPSARGHGVGKRLVDVCITRSRESAAAAVALHTAAFMGAAMSLYESVGFRRAPEFDRDAYSMFRLPARKPSIAALAYILELAGDRTLPSGVGPQ